MTQSNLTWKRFLSWQFLINKLREKGGLWFLRRFLSKLGFGIYWRIRNSSLGLIAGPLYLLASRLDLAAAHFYLGNILYKLGDTAGAIESYEKVVKLKPNWVEAYLQLATILFNPSEIDLLERTIIYLRQAIALKPNSIKAHLKLGLALLYHGEFAESIKVNQTAVKLHQKKLKNNPLSQLGIRFLTSEYYTNWNWLGAIGHLAANIRYYNQVGILGQRPQYRTILLAPYKQVANLCLLNYWRRYLTIVTNPLLIACLQPIAKHLRLLEYSLYNVTPDNRQMLYVSDACAVVQKQWEAEGRPSLLALLSSDRERGWQCLQELGLPKNAWFVSLHVREGGFSDRGKHSVYTYRNSDINTHRMGIQSIVRRGGWVIRLGDRTMKPLSPMPQAIDYALSDIKSDWMDIFLLSQCRFFIGTSSGPCDIPPIFGVPSILVNVWPIWEGTTTSKDIFIPKLLWSKDEKRYLTFEEASENRLWKNYNSNLIASWGIEVVDNTPEEIDEVVVEMLERFEGHSEYDLEDELLKEKFNILAAPHLGYVPNNRVGRKFLRKWSWLLPDAKER